MEGVKEKNVFGEKREFNPKTERMIIKNLIKKELNITGGKKNGNLVGIDPDLLGLDSLNVFHKFHTGALTSNDYLEFRRNNLHLILPSDDIGGKNNLNNEGDSIRNFFNWISTAIQFKVSTDKDFAKQYDEDDYNDYWGGGTYE